METNDEYMNEGYQLECLKTRLPNNSLVKLVNDFIESLKNNATFEDFTSFYELNEAKARIVEQGLIDLQDTINSILGQQNNVDCVDITYEDQDKYPMITRQKLDTYNNELIEKMLSSKRCNRLEEEYLEKIKDNIDQFITNLPVKEEDKQKKKNKSSFLGCCFSSNHKKGGGNQKY